MASVPSIALTAVEREHKSDGIFIYICIFYMYIYVYIHILYIYIYTYIYIIPVIKSDLKLHFDGIDDEIYFYDVYVCI
jgi:hypothetical protein